jgi:hypothetical protein
VLDHYTCDACSPSEVTTKGILNPIACEKCGVVGPVNYWRSHIPSSFANVYTGEAASLTRDKRPWYDWGKDTGPRLRVKGLVDADALPVRAPEALPNAVDPREVDEIHRRSQQAFADEDDHTLGKIYEDVLDALHSANLPSVDEDPIEKIRLDLRAKELEQALGAELAELGRCRRWAVGYTLDERGGAVVLLVAVRDKVAGIDWLVNVDQRALVTAVQRAGADVRTAAREIATRVRAEVDQARAGASVGSN